MSAIYKRELKALFNGMIAPVFIAFLLLMTGIYSTSVNFGSGYPQFEYAIPSITFIFLLIVPILTMRSFAEDKANRTDQLLYSLPISTSSIVIGKYLAMVTVLGIASLVMCLFPIIISIYGDVFMTTAYASILAFFLLGCALIAIGMFISTLTESQVIAAVLSIGTFLLVYLISNVAALIPSTALTSALLFAALALLISVIVFLLTKNTIIATVFGVVLIVADTVIYLIDSSLFEGLFATMLEKLALFDTLSNFVYGVFDLGSVIYYLTIVFLFGFFTVQAFDKKRWN